MDQRLSLSPSLAAVTCRRLASSLLLSAALSACGPGGREVTLPNTARITAEDGAANNHFGYSLALDSGRAVVGAPGSSDRHLSAGAAYVFQRRNARWAQEEKLLAADSSTDHRLGTAVAIDGDRIAVAARGPTAAGKRSGAVYLYERVDDTWVRVRKFTSSLTNDRFAGSIALKDDRLIVGAPGDARHGLDAGAVYIYRFAPEGWVQEGRIHARHPVPRARFGASVVHGGGWIAVGAPSEDSRGPGSGAVHLFRLNGGIATPDAIFYSPDPSNDGNYGSALSISGTRLAVGAPMEDGWLRDTGAVYVYHYKKGGWGLEGELDTGAFEGGLFFGCSVAMDGEILLAGARGHDVSGWESGSAHLFRRKGESWVHEAFLKPTRSVKNGYFGHAVDLEGRNGLIGAYGHRTMGAWSGAAFAF